MDLALQGCRIVVTGATGGIGSAVATQLRSEGCEVVGLGRTGESDGEYPTIDADLATDAGRTDVLARIGAEPIDGMVLSAGIAPVRAEGVGVSLEQWKATFELNLFANIVLVQKLLPLMRSERSGAIVAIGSTSARIHEPAMVDYGASKAALAAWIGALALDIAPRGLRSLVVAPGSTRTPLWDRSGGFVDSLAERYGLPAEDAVRYHIETVRGIALGRPGTAEEVANAVLFALSSRASFISGTSIDIHGAMAAHLM